MQKWVLKAMAIAMLALPVAGIGNAAAAAGGDAFVYGGDRQAGDYKINLAPSRRVNKPTKYIHTAAWLEARPKVVATPGIINTLGANENGWYGYEILNPPATGAQRLDRVIFQYQVGGGTVHQIIKQEYCIQTSYFLQSARQYFLATTGKDICTCTANASGQCQ